MMKQASVILIATLALGGCKKKEEPPPAPPAQAAAPEPPKSATPPLEPNNIVSIAVGSKDHTTLVAALKAADYVTPVAASGPLTVFAPTNAAFDKLPAGTVDTLVKPENVDTLRNILKYHVTTSVYTDKEMTDGMVMAMANGAKATIKITEGKIMINDANVIASIRGSNGVVHVIDAVLTPPAAAP
jgi:uncharacterized surface protein with fasciclin (FAS1) repeats